MTDQEKIEKIEELKYLINKAEHKLLNLQDEVKNTCRETCINYKEYKDSYEGNYYDKAYTNYWKHCKICGKVSEIVKVIDGGYG